MPITFPIDLYFTWNPIQRYITWFRYIASAGILTDIATFSWMNAMKLVSASAPLYEIASMQSRPRIYLRLMRCFAFYFTPRAITNSNKWASALYCLVSVRRGTPSAARADFGLRRCRAMTRRRRRGRCCRHLVLYLKRADTWAWFRSVSAASARWTQLSVDSPGASSGGSFFRLVGYLFVGWFHSNAVTVFRRNWSDEKKVHPFQFCFCRFFKKWGKINTEMIYVGRFRHRVQSIKRTPKA